MSKTNIWTGPQLMRFNAVPKYALKFDGVNDFLQSENTFVQWQSNQAFTMFLKVKNANVATGNRFIFDARQDESTTGVQSKGLFFYCNSTFIEMQMSNRSTVFIRVNFAANLNGDFIFQLTYDGSANGNNVNAYKDNTLLSRNLINNNLSGSIVGTSRYRIGNRNAFLSSQQLDNYFNGEIISLSFSNFVKSSIELTADFNAGMDLTANPLSPTYDPSKQLLHVAPIYKTYIKTLDSTQTFQAFQGGNPINMELIGYPDELILNTHLIKL